MKRLIAKQKGVTQIEFSLIALAVILVLFLIMEFAVYFFPCKWSMRSPEELQGLRPCVTSPIGMTFRACRRCLTFTHQGSPPVICRLIISMKLVQALMFLDFYPHHLRRVTY